MSRGVKLDLAIGASFEDGWSVVKEEKKSALELKEPAKHQLVFKREKRRGKVVTLVGEFFLEKKEAQKELKKLKSSLACGGSFKDGWMEFQGEVRERLKRALQEEGFSFKT